MPSKSVAYDEDCAKGVQILAREEMKLKLLNDILIDSTICEIEGWDKKQYLIELNQLIQSFIKKM